MIRDGLPSHQAPVPYKITGAASAATSQIVHMMLSGCVFTLFFVRRPLGCGRVAQPAGNEAVMLRAFTVELVRFPKRQPLTALPLPLDRSSRIPRRCSSPSGSGLRCLRRGQRWHG